MIVKTNKFTVFKPGDLLHYRESESDLYICIKCSDTNYSVDVYSICFDIFYYNVWPDRFRKTFYDENKENK